MRATCQQRKLGPTTADPETHAIGGWARHQVRQGLGKSRQEASGRILNFRLLAAGLDKSRQVYVDRKS